MANKSNLSAASDSLYRSFFLRIRRHADTLSRIFASAPFSSPRRLADTLSRLFASAPFSSPRRHAHTPSRPHVSSNGYALYLVLVVLSITLIFITIALRASSFVRLQTINKLLSTQSRLLAESGLERVEFFFNGGDNHDIFWESDSFYEEMPGYGKIHLSCKRFGAYARITSTGTRIRKSWTIKGIAGRDIPENLRPVLSLTNRIGGLILENGSVINGSVALNGGDIRRGKNRVPVRGIPVQGFGDKPTTLPYDVSPLITYMKACREKVAAASNDTTVIKGNISYPGGADSLFKQKLLVIHGDLEIQSGVMKDAEIIVNGGVTVRGGATCINTAIYCKTAQFKGGVTERSLFYCDSIVRIEAGRHNSQFLSTDSMLIGGAASFGPVNTWLCLRGPGKDSTLKGVVVFPENARCSGNIICFSDSTVVSKVPLREGPGIILGKGSVFTGTMVTNGDISMNSVTVKGNIWARAIQTSEKGIMYVNWLMGCTLESVRIDAPFPLVGEKPVKVVISDY